MKETMTDRLERLQTARADARDKLWRMMREESAHEWKYSAAAWADAERAEDDADYFLRDARMRAAMEMAYHNPIPTRKA